MPYGFNQDWLIFNIEATKELFCPMCGKKVYPLAQNEEVCEHLFAVCKEDSILYASEAFYEIISYVYDLPRAVLLDCISQGTSFSEVAKKEDKWLGLDSSFGVRKWADTLDGIHSISHDKEIPSYMISLYEEIHGNDGPEWHHKVFVQLAAKDIASKYLKQPCD